MSTPTRRFHVEQTDEGIVLVDRQDTEHEVEVRRALVHLTIEARLQRVCRSLVPGGLERWLTLEIEEISLGSEADFSDLSMWPEDGHDHYDAENKLFGIDGADLKHLEITQALVVNLEARGRYGHPYIVRSTQSTRTGEDDERGYEEHEQGEDYGPVADLWYQTSEDESGYGWSALVLTVGFPEPQFGELIDACVSGRADTLVLQCRFYANTTGWAFQTARDLILSPGETLRLHIDEATVSVPVPTVASERAAGVDGDESGDEADDESWDRKQSDSEPRAAAVAGYALLVATIAVSVLAALFGASAVAVLTIAILGGTAALIATLRSIGIVMTERLTLISEVNVQHGRR